ncbi:MAG: biopolymer transporter ExbD [Bacteroidales bacterium]|nr:biopolymer transporter ExbD [Bacteroidales bacterium]
MKIRRNTNLLIEPPAVATGDIAFNLLVFFLVCASSQPDSGRRQELPRSEQEKHQKQEKKNIEVSMGRTTLSIGEEGNLVETTLTDFPSRIRQSLSTRSAAKEDRIVVVRSTKDTPYERWITVTGMIESAGGVITLQLQEEQEILIP